MQGSGGRGRREGHSDVSRSSDCAKASPSGGQALSEACRSPGDPVGVSPLLHCPSLLPARQPAPYASRAPPWCPGCQEPPFLTLPSRVSWFYTLNATSHPASLGMLVIRCRPRPRLSWLAQGAAPLAARRPSPAARTKQRWCLLWGERPREQEQDQRSAPSLGLSCQQARHLAPLSMQSVLQTGPAFAVRRHPCLEGCLDEMGHSQCGCMFKFLFLLFSC